MEEGLEFCLKGVSDVPNKRSGKVRDIWEIGDKLAIAATDRLSAFDRFLTLIPYKGAVTNLTSAWWFERTRHITPNHLVSVPDPNVSLVRKCTVFQVEMVVRGYVTGSTDTSLWTHYKKGVRNYCGNIIPDGLKKNDRLPEAIVTPTTKSDEHDELITPKEIVDRGLMSAPDWEDVRNRALKLFAFGQQQAKEHGLILVDTKYEFGRTPEGEILLIDEIHTPDSSRYWIASSYDQRMAEGKEPENIDKEFVRLWYRDHCDPYRDEVLPEAPQELRLELSRRYVNLYERITGQGFPYEACKGDPNARIHRNMQKALS